MCLVIRDVSRDRDRDRARERDIRIGTEKFARKPADDEKAHHQVRDACMHPT